MRCRLKLSHLEAFIVAETCLLSKAFDSLGTTHGSQVTSESFSEGFIESAWDYIAQWCAWGGNRIRNIYYWGGKRILIFVSIFHLSFLFNITEIRLALLQLSSSLKIDQGGLAQPWPCDSRFQRFGDFHGLSLLQLGKTNTLPLKRWWTDSYLLASGHHSN